MKQETGRIFIYYCKLVSLGTVINLLFNWNDRQGKSSNSALSNPLIVNSYVGVLSGMEIIAIILFFLFLAWTFYAHISNDFKKMTPNKSFKLNE